jgi:hypothetical protein
VEKGEETSFIELENLIQAAESVKYPSTLVSGPMTKSKLDKTNKGGFGSFFGGTSASKASNGTNGSLRSIFGRTTR